MIKNLALVLACDLLRDGSDIGPQTVLRLERALAHWRRTGERLVVAASWSPRHPHQPKPMAQMMCDWLVLHGCDDVLVIEATCFRTKGELEAFLCLPGAHTIISDEAHLLRTRALIERVYGTHRAATLQCVSTESQAMTGWGRRLEPAKLWYVRHFPLALDDVTWRIVTWLTVRLGINLSY